MARWGVRGVLQKPDSGRHLDCCAEGMDMQRIELSEPGALERWAAQLAVPVPVLEEALRRVGTDLDKVKGYLAAHPQPAAPGNDG